jgi:hypothetical protein
MLIGKVACDAAVADANIFCQRSADIAVASAVTIVNAAVGFP